MQTTEISNIFETAVEHHEAGLLERAQRSYMRVLEIVPNHPAALHALAVIASDRNDWNLAIELAGKAIEVMPQIPQFYHTIAGALEKIGRNKQAIEAWQKAVELKPDYLHAYNSLAKTLQNNGDYDQAIINYKHVIKLNPNFAEAYYNLGLIENKLKRYSEAVENYKRVIELIPDHIEVYNDLAGTLIWQGHYAEAVENCLYAIKLQPDYAQAYNTMASAQFQQGHYDQAIESYRKTIELMRHNSAAHSNLAISLLLKGDFIEGWREYEFRATNKINLPQPRWDGSSFEGKRLLVFREQGFGDSIHLVRYLPMVKALGGTVIFRDRKEILGLLSEFPGIDELIESDHEINFDCQISLLSLPGIFATTLDTIPADVPYLYADPAKAEYWRGKLSGPDFKVGIVWAGSSIHKNDHNRSCELKDFAALGKIDGVRLYGLQKGDSSWEVENLFQDMGVTNLGDMFEDFSDTAGAIENLDLVISVDTSVLHLAAAMGKPTWALLPFVPDWRWLLSRQDSPWYPTMKIFRQKESGQWQELFDQVATNLKTLTAEENKK